MRDGAANLWATLPGASTKSLVIGSHLDSVPGGGWLDGCLGVLAGLEVLRRAKADGHAAADDPPRRLGRRGRRALRAQPDGLRGVARARSMRTRSSRTSSIAQGVKLPDALAENGITLDGMGTARAYFDALDAVAYLELHIEQGPVLEDDEEAGRRGARHDGRRALQPAVHRPGRALGRRADPPAQGRVPRRRRVRARVPRDQHQVLGQDAAHARGRDVRRGEGRAELRDRGAGLDRRSRSICARSTRRCCRRCSPMRSARRSEGGEEAPRQGRVEPAAPHHAAPVRRDADEVRPRSRSRRSPAARPSFRRGPLHDAAEMAAVVPTAMVFAMSSPGISHTRLEDTPTPALDKSIRAFLLDGRAHARALRSCGAGPLEGAPPASQGWQQRPAH